MPFTDRQAARKVRELREDAGLSQERLAAALRRRARAGDWPAEVGTVDASTIRAIEDLDHVPSQRIKVALALYFDVPWRSIWERENCVPEATPIRARLRPQKQHEVAA